MEKKNLDWANLDFSYRKTDKRFVSNYRKGAWDEGKLTDDDLERLSRSSAHSDSLHAALQADLSVDEEPASIFGSAAGAKQP